MSGRSQYDPLDMALGVLARPVSPIADTAPSEVPRPRQVTRHATPSAKTSTNIRMSPRTLDRLRGASIQLGREYTLGEIIDRLVDAQLDDVVSAMMTEPRASRLKPGRRVGSMRGGSSGVTS